MRGSIASNGFFLLAALTTFACSSAPPGATPGPVESTAEKALAQKYCQATLKKDQALLHSTGTASTTDTGAWASSSDRAAAGSTFMLTADYERGNIWLGIALTPDGVPMRIDGDATSGLVKGVDFATSCGVDDKPIGSVSDWGLVTPTTAYENKDLTGKTCDLAVGTKMTYFEHAGGVSHPLMYMRELKAVCGFEEGYTPELKVGALYPLQ